MPYPRPAKAPPWQKKLRKDLQKDFGDEYAELLRIMGAVRGKLLQQAHAPEEHKPLFEKLINSDILGAIKKQDRTQIDELLRAVFGADYQLNDLDL